MKKKLHNTLKFMRKNKVFTKLLSVFLSLVLIFYVIPSSIYTAAAEAFSGNENDSGEVYTSEYALDNTLLEEVSLREENVKHFRLSDGSYVAAQYNYPVHYLSDGEWLDIDNSLSASGSEFSNSNARIKFSKKINGSSNLFTLHDGNAKITLNLLDANKGVIGQITNDTDDPNGDELQKMMYLENLSSKILYPEAQDGVDLEYIATSMNVKENIIVKEKRDSYSFSFELKLNGLSAQINESGDIILTDEDTGSVKYTIPAPVVYDSDDNYAPSEKASYTLTHKNGNKYILTVSVDSDWMNDEERVYPVTIDPAIQVSRPSLIDTFIASYAPNTSYYNNSFLTLSPDTIVYLMLTSLPNIGNASYIIDAQLLMTMYRDPSNSYVGVYDVLTQWGTNTTWAKHVSTTSIPEGELAEYPVDYLVLNGYGTYSWNVTKLVKEWYDGDNIGVALKTPDNYSAIALFCSSEASTTSNHPMFIIQYRNMRGLEDYWPYSSHSASGAGTGSVNLANGNLTFSIPTLTTTDGLFGYTPTLYYNSSLANKLFIYGNAKTANTVGYMPSGFKLSVDETVIEESCGCDRDNVTHLIHVDSDGTEHIYHPSGKNIYHDEDGLGKTMTVGTTTLEISDDSHVIKRFAKIANPYPSVLYSAWRLTEIEDVAGNKLIFTFKSGVLPKYIKLRPNGQTSDILLMTFLYSSNDMLCAVYDHGTQNAVVLKYTGETRLANIEFCYIEGYLLGDDMAQQPLEEYACYGIINQPPIVEQSFDYFFDTSGKMTWAGDSYTRHGVNYSWSGNKIIRITEEVDQESGACLAFEYGTRNTNLTSPGNDGIIGNSDDIVTKYTLDVFGRAISKYSISSDGSELYGATVGVYDTQDKTKNSLIEKAVLGHINANLLLNSDFHSYVKDQSTYLISDWTNSVDITKLSPNGIGGYYPDSIEFRPTPESASYIYQDVTLQPGEYTLTVNYSGNKCNGIVGYAQILNTSTLEVIKSEKLDMNTQTDIRRGVSSFTFSIDSTMQVRVKLIFSTSSEPSTDMNLTAGMIKLEHGSTGSAYTAVEYGDFSSVTEWTTNNGTTPLVYTDPETGNKSLMINGAAGESYAKQTLYSASDSLISMVDNSEITVSNNEHSFTVSGFAKADNAIVTRPIRMRVDVSYYYGPNTNDRTFSHYFDFAPGVSDWQFASGSIVLGIDPATGEKITNYLLVKSVVLYCETVEQINVTALFDNISVTYSGLLNTTKTQYDENGRISRIQNGYYFESYEYNDQGNIYKIKKPDRIVLEYEYCQDNPNLVSCITERIYYTLTHSQETAIGNVLIDHIYSDSIIREKNRTAYSYNNYGQITEVYTVQSYDDLISREVYEYETTTGSKLFGLLLSEQSAADSRTEYFYENYSGRLLASVNTYSGSGYVYTYDNFGRLTAVYPITYTASNNSYTANTSAERVTYTYNRENRLGSISTRSTTYNFTYDIYGNTDSIKIGDTTLVSYEYNEYNGSLKKVTYGNGCTIEYSYNYLGQISEIKCDTNVRYTYEYTTDGELFRVNDIESGISTLYFYDSERRFIGSKEYDTNTADVLISTNAKYDQKGNVSYVAYDFTYRTPSASFEDSVAYSYTYHEDGRIESGSITSGDLSYGISYNYDSLDRVSSVVYNDNSSSFSNSVSYTYKSDTAYGETGLVETYTSVIGNNTSTYTYTYDSNGNIVKIVDGNGKVTRYYYDDLGQLMQEELGAIGAYMYYSYDHAGNILYKKGTLTRACSFQYNNVNWPDQLTGVNGIDIIYDAIGNPLSYYNGFTFTWEGRNLISAVKGTDVYTFTYNDDGLRTSKTKNGTTTNYYYSGSLLIEEKADSYTIVYLYGIDNAPIGFKIRFNDSTIDVWDEYFYEKNLQGDIVAIYDLNGNKHYSYLYDSWGLFARTQHTPSPSTAFLNPLLYRGYYYDSDLGLYYLQSRYYDPNTCRFINADGYVSTGQGLTGYNMFAYCGNNPVMRVDYTGQFWNEIWEFAKTTVTEMEKAMVVVSPAYAGCGGATVADGPLPFGDIVALVGIVLLTVGVIGYGIYQATQTQTISTSKTEDKSEVITATQPAPTIIYRYGGTNPGNLTPRAKDMYSGLSFSTVPMPGAAMTTIEALNATGVVYAVKDGDTHVSVRPVGATMEDWINAGSDSIWTQAVSSVVIKWGGNY